MNKLKKNERGFGAIEATLLVVILITLIGVGYYVYKAKQNTSALYNQTATTSVVKKPTVKSKSTTPVNDPTANWQTVKSSDASFSIKIPQSWVSITCQPFGGGGPNLYIASSQTYLAKCNSDFIGEASFISAADQSASTAPTKGSTDQSFSTQAVTLDAVSGYKTTNLTSASDALTPNTTYTTYSFYSNNMSFYARYQQITNGPNDLATFNQIVQTWKF